MINDVATDGELLAATAIGNDAAFGILVRRHIRAATLLAAQLTGDRDDAEDVVQEAFTIAHRRARGVDGNAFRAWLYGVVRRLANRRRVRAVRRRRLWQRWGSELERADAANPESALLARLDLESIPGAFARLSAMQRACFELVVLKELTPRDVASMHDIAESTVRQHVFRARQALRNALADTPARDAPIGEGCRDA